MVKEIVEAYPEAVRIHLVWDNLNAHREKPLVAAFVPQLGCHSTRDAFGEEKASEWLWSAGAVGSIRSGAEAGVGSVSSHFTRL